MKAITSAFSLVALLGALVILPGCGGGDEAVPAGDTDMPTATDPVVETGEGDMGAMEGPAVDAPVDVPPAEPAAP